MASVAELLDAATARIHAALGGERRDARLDARVLAAHAWNVAPAWLLAHDTDAVDAARAALFGQQVEARAAGRPVAHLVGYREFYGRRFAVTPDVLIPRPETELLVEAALARLPPDTPVRVLDLGTGSGCIAVSLALARPRARVTAVEASAAALAVAVKNAQQSGAKIEFLQGDWLCPVADRQFDMIVGNPPYIARTDPHLARGDVRFDPPQALGADEQGLADLRRIIASSRTCLRPDGCLLLEHGYNQAAEVRRLLRDAGFAEIQTLRDLQGIERVSVGCRISLHGPAAGDLP